jgi:hypothetical protein
MGCGASATTAKGSKDWKTEVVIHPSEDSSTSGPSRTAVDDAVDEMGWGSTRTDGTESGKQQLGTSQVAPFVPAERESHVSSSSHPPFRSVDSRRSSRISAANVDKPPRLSPRASLHDHDDSVVGNIKELRKISKISSATIEKAPRLSLGGRTASPGSSRFASPRTSLGGKTASPRGSCVASPRMSQVSLLLSEGAIESMRRMDSNGADSHAGEVIHERSLESGDSEARGKTHQRFSVTPTEKVGTIPGEARSSDASMAATASS